LSYSTDHLGQPHEWAWTLTTSPHKAWQDS
jgi:hypothetical protein